MESRYARSKAAAVRVIESDALLAVGFAVMAGTITVLVGQYLTLHRYDTSTAPWPVEHFCWTALAVACGAALLGWVFGKVIGHA